MIVLGRKDFRFVDGSYCAYIAEMNVTVRVQVHDSGLSVCLTFGSTSTPISESEFVSGPVVGLQGETGSVAMEIANQLLIKHLFGIV